MLNCTYALPQAIVNVWSPVKVTNITVATLVVVVDHYANTTSTSTQYVESRMVNGSIPTNFGGINAAGTATEVVTFVNGSTTTV